MEGLRQRNEMVIQFSQSIGIPIVTVMSGGYAQDVNDTVEIHCSTFRAAKMCLIGAI